MLGFLLEVVVAIVIAYVIAYNTFLQRVISEHISLGRKDAAKRTDASLAKRKASQQHRRQTIGGHGGHAERQSASSVHRQLRRGGPADGHTPESLGLSFTASSTRQSNHSFTNTSDGKTGSENWSWSERDESTVDGDRGSLNDERSSSEWSSDGTGRENEPKAAPNVHGEHVAGSRGTSVGESKKQCGTSERLSDASDSVGQVSEAPNERRRHRVAPDHETHQRFRRQRRRHFFHRSHANGAPRGNRTASEKANLPCGSDGSIDVVQETTRWVEGVVRWAALVGIGGGSPDPNVWVDHVAYLAVSALSSTDHKLEKAQRRKAAECAAAVREEATRGLSDDAAILPDRDPSRAGGARSGDAFSHSFQSPEFPSMFGTSMSRANLPHNQSVRKHSKRAVELIRVALGGAAMSIAHASPPRTALRGMHLYPSTRDPFRSNGRSITTSDVRLASSSAHHPTTGAVSAGGPAGVSVSQPFSSGRRADDTFIEASNAMARPSRTDVRAFDVDGRTSSQRASPSPAVAEPSIRATDDSIGVPATPQHSEPNAVAPGESERAEGGDAKTQGGGSLWKWVPKSVNFSFMSSSRVRTSFERQQEYVMTQLAKLQADLFGSGAAGKAQKRSDSMSPAAGGASTPVSSSVSVRAAPHVAAQGVPSLSSLTLPPVCDDASANAPAPLDSRRLSVLPHRSGIDPSVGGDSIVRGSSVPLQRASAKVSPAPQHARGQPWAGHSAPSITVGFVLPSLRSVRSATVSSEGMSSLQRNRADSCSCGSTTQPNTQEELEAMRRGSEVKGGPFPSLRVTRYFEASLEYEDMNFCIRLGCNIPLFAFLSFPLVGADRRSGVGDAENARGVRLSLPPDFLSIRCVIDASRIKFVGKVYVCVSGNTVEFGFPTVPAYAVTILPASTSGELDEWKRLSSAAQAAAVGVGARPSMPSVASDTASVAMYPSPFTLNTYAAYMREVENGTGKFLETATAPRRAGTANGHEFSPSRSGCISPSNEKVQEMIHLAIKNALGKVTYPQVLHARVAKRGKRHDQLGSRAPDGSAAQSKVTFIGPLAISWRLQTAAFPPPPPPPPPAAAESRRALSL